VGEKNMIMVFAGPETNNACVVKAQQQFTRLDPDHTPAARHEVCANKWSDTSSNPYVFMTRCLIQHRGISTSFAYFFTHNISGVISFLACHF
jgi:hypothetical protein